MSLELGKRVGDELYLHHTALVRSKDEQLRALAQSALEAISPSAYPAPNVFKINQRLGRASWLAYPDFDTDPFPALAASWAFTRESLASPTLRVYTEGINPPILHRKELLVPLDHPLRPEWVALTAAAESLGLFDDTSTIGFRLNWDQRIAAKGYQLRDGAFVPLGNDEFDAPNGVNGLHSPSPVRRHLTALSRTGLSAPVQLLIRHGLLTPSTPLFDYGCGKGDDLASLKAEGYAATGWDPHYAPGQPRQEAHVVNLGFVLNVIEDPAERVEALVNAFRLTTGVLAVAVMLPAGQAGRPWGDGVMTSRGTFQKYFAQSELKDFLEHVLQQDAFLVGPGVAFVFADRALEQGFMAQRFRRRDLGWRLLMAAPRRTAAPKAPKELKAPKLTKAEFQLQTVRPHLNALWLRALELGRWPEEEDVTDLAESVSVLGGLPKALRTLRRHFDLQLLQQAAVQRTDDLRLFMAVMQFDERPPYRRLDSRLQRDVKAFFGDYRSAQAAGMRLLLAAADPANLLVACHQAAEQGLGHLQGEHDLQLHVGLVERLPAVLRAYVACGLVLWGGLSDVQMVKIHIGSGKLTLLEYDDFDTSPLPLLRRRIKVNVRKQDYDLFEYGSPTFPKPPLYRKSRFMNEEQDGYAQQQNFDQALEATGLIDSEAIEPSFDKLILALERQRLEISGWTLGPSQQIPDLDDPCGANFKFRDFIECGETQQRLGVRNVPLRPETYNAIYELATRVLDPVVEYFGAIRLTYGFCGAELGKQIRSRVAPKLDQHACWERNRSGHLICERGGAACDFIVEDEDMREVGRWIAQHLPFDRMYFYGSAQPLHVSIGPQLARSSFFMATNQLGRLFPRSLSWE